MKRQSPTSINEYTLLFPAATRRLLETIRRVVHRAVPDATEAISYQMPTFKLLGKNLVHFAAWKTHIGFYPTPSGMAAFTRQLSRYRTSKGAVQFPLEKPLPLDLIARISVFRAREITGTKAPSGQ